MEEFTSTNWLPVFRPRTVDRMFRWSPGTALSFARQGLLPHVLRDGKVRFDEACTLSLCNHYRGYMEDERFADAFPERDILGMALEEMARVARRKLGMTGNSFKGDEEDECEE